jgi:hypothetical protein
VIASQLLAAAELSDDIQTSNIISKIVVLTLHFPALRYLWSPQPYFTAALLDDLKQTHESVAPPGRGRRPPPPAASGSDLIMSHAASGTQPREHSFPVGGAGRAQWCRSTLSSSANGTLEIQHVRLHRSAPSRTSPKL